MSVQKWNVLAVSARATQPECQGACARGRERGPPLGPQNTFCTIVIGFDKDEINIVLILCMKIEIFYIMVLYFW